MIHREVVVGHELGVHALVAHDLAEQAAHFDSSLFLRTEGRSASLRNVVDVLAHGQTLSNPERAVLLARAAGREPDPLPVPTVSESVADSSPLVVAMRAVVPPDSPASRLSSVAAGSSSNASRVSGTCHAGGR